MSIKSEILGIAKEHGYEGSAQTITGAINALTDTLAGEDVAGGRTVASAIHKLAPYVSAGGGGGGAYIVNLTASSAQGPYTADKTAAEIYEHASSGEQVIGMISLSAQAGSGSLGPITQTIDAALACTVSTQKPEAGERSYSVTFTHAMGMPDGSTIMLLNYVNSSGAADNTSYALVNKTLS